MKNTPADPSAVNLTAKSLRRKLPTGAKIDYLLFLPKGYDEDSTNNFPLILFLHGRGDGGTDNVGQIYWMSNLRANTAAGQYAAYILAPQNNLGAEWYSAGKQPAEIEMLMMSLVFVYINVLRVVASRRR